MVIERQKARKDSPGLEKLNKELRLLASRLTLAEENERHNIAAALHERTNETLVSSAIRLAALARSVSDPSLAEALHEVRQLLEKLAQETRLMIFEISPPSLYHLGLEAAIQELTDHMAKKYGFRSSFSDDCHPKPLDDDVRILLYQSVRELLTNVGKHARAQNVRVNVRRLRNNIRITVEDDGIGFGKADNSVNKEEGGFGLFSIRERLQNIGGHLKLESDDGGTCITLTAALREE